MSVTQLNKKVKSRDAAAPAGRAWVKYLIIAVLALIGLSDAIYLTVEHLAGRTVQCLVTSGCSAVLGSSYAVIGDIPLAALGAAAYFTVFSLAVLAAFSYPKVPRLLSVVVGLMFTFTLWLLYLQAFVLNAYCAYCLLSAAVTTTLASIIFFGKVWREK